MLSWLPGIYVVYHEHDSPVDGGPQGLFQRLLLWTRRKIAHRSECCILPNQQRIERFKLAVGGSPGVFCVWNCPTKDEVSGRRPALDGEELWLLYHGSIVPARLPLTVLSALAMLPSCVKLRVIGYETVGHGRYLENLKETANQLRVADRIQILGTVATRKELLEWCQRSDVGLALMPWQSEDPNEQTMTGASNKPFDYLACGLPILVNNLEDWRELFVAPGYGLACDASDPISIASAVRYLLEHPDQLRQMGERGRLRIELDWNYERQFEPVIAMGNN